MTSPIKHLSQSVLVLIMLTCLACGDGADGSSKAKGKEGTKTVQPKAETRTLSKQELAYVGEWKVAKYYVPGAEYELKGKGRFLTLRKDGTVSCDFPMDEPENPQENGAKGTGTWKLQTPRPKFWEGKIPLSENKDEKYALTATDGEVLVLTLKTDQGAKELKYLASFTGRKGREMSIGLPSYYFGLTLVR